MDPSDPTAAALADLQWLRRLAAVLATDADDADDLAQETLVAAWTTPPNEPGPVRPWLASVLRNRFRMLRRGRARREERELAGVTAASSSGEPERDVERLEVLRILLAELETLSKEDRAIVVRRFFDDESAVEIGRALDMPAATVRSRIHRSLQRLRQRLDRRCGDRRTWCAALGVAPNIGQAVAAETGTGGSSMLIKGIVLAGALTAVGSIWWSAFRDPQHDRSEPLAPVDAEAPPAISAERRVWEDRRSRIRRSLPSIPPRPVVASSTDEERSQRLLQTYRELVDLCLEDLGSDVNGAISLDVVEIGSPDVGVIYESVDVVASTIRDPELEQCIVESMYAFVGDGVLEPYERKSTLTSQIGDSEDPRLEAQRRFDAIVGAHVGEVSFCEQQSEVAVGGRLPVRASIADGGIVSAVVVGDNELPSEFVECTVRAMKRWKFPPDTAGRELEYAFELPIRERRDEE
jgi:RNA polymerase sigma factor (sigma-70 family)